MGGDGFLMLYRRAAGRVEVVNATGPAPARATRERYLDQGIPLKGIGSVSVPGLVDGWLEAHARYGRLALASTLKPAIQVTGQLDESVPRPVEAGQGGFPQFADFSRRIDGSAAFHRALTRNSGFSAYVCPASGERRTRRERTK